MPTYEYRCPEGHLFEHFFRKISDSVAELPCPECGKEATRQMSAGAGLVFKGSGFYLTDYGKNAHRKGGESGRAAAHADGKGHDVASGDGLTSDAKHDAKSEAKGAETGTTSSKASSEAKASDTKTGSSTSTSSSGASSTGPSGSGSSNSANNSTKSDK